MKNDISKEAIREFIKKTPVKVLTQLYFKLLNEFHSLSKSGMSDLQKAERRNEIIETIKAIKYRVPRQISMQTDIFLANKEAWEEARSKFHVE